jgi:alpha/beta superfamily hydrolase
MPAVKTHDSRFVQGPAGRLDVRQVGAPDAPAVLLLHPHPQFGGTMGSRLVHDLATGLAATHLVTRFNFRGVGRSEGTYGGGSGEAEDAAAVFDQVTTLTGQEPTVIGYSFGGAVACRLATMRTLPRLGLIGTPLRLTESDLVPRDDAARILGTPDVLVLVGERDGFVTPDEAGRLAAAFEPPGTVQVLAGAGHFLEPSHNEAAVAAIKAWLAR